tara:strand:- start:814 stop:2184 length:1371 start_codon:yes stop_codon:yes gene_type:complete
MTQNNSGFLLSSILLISERLTESVELNRIVTDVEIFEHIEKPYLTGRIMLVDDSSFYENADIQGSERIQITIESAEEDSTPITKTFFVSKVEKIQKVSDSNAQTLMIHLVQDVFYISSLKNINRHYTGSRSNIIGKIAQNFLNKKVFLTGKDRSVIEVIVPNLHPLEAMMWLNSKAVSARGYPFYLYSTLVGDDFRMENLGDILLRPALNGGKDEPAFTIASTKAQDTMNVTLQRRIVENHSMNSQENLLDLIRTGLISSNYEYIDTLTENTKSFSYNSRKDLFKKLIQDGILNEKQKNPQIDFAELIEDKTIDKFKPLTCTYVGGSMAFRDSDTAEGFTPFTYNAWSNSYGEYKTGADYKLNVISATMDAILKKNPLTINVKGLEFIKGDAHRTIGNNISVAFQSTHNKAPNLVDEKKSGDYLIYSVRHMFKKTVDTYDVSMNCVKIGNLRRAAK